MLRARPGRHDRDILLLALPALGALAADPLVSLVDTAFVGRLGALPLAALGVNTSVFALAFFAFNFLAYGTTPLVARALGRGDRALAGRTAVQALTLAGLLGVAVLLALQALAAPILWLMGARGELLEPALGYLRLRALAGPAVLFITAGNGIFRGFQDTRTPLLITLGLNLVNLALDALFIFGLGWGLTGAAAATVIAQWLGALAFLWLLLGPRRSRYGLSLSLPRPAELRPFLRIGWELALRTSALLATLTLSTAVAARLGVTEVAARLLVMGLAVGALLGLGFWLLRGPLARLFTDDPAVVAAVLALFPFIAAMQPLNALVFVWDGVFIGAGDFRYLALAMLLAAAAGSALLLVLPAVWSLAGVWWAIVGFMLVRALTLLWRYRRPQALA